MQVVAVGGHVVSMVQQTGGGGDGGGDGRDVQCGDVGSLNTQEVQCYVAVEIVYLQ